MKDENMLIKEYRKRCSEYRLLPREGEWERLEAELHSGRCRQPLIRPVRFRTLTALTVIALLTGLSLLYIKKKNTAEPQFTGKQYLIPAGRSPVIPEIPPEPSKLSPTGQIAHLPSGTKTPAQKTTPVPLPPENSPSPACAVTDTFAHHSGSNEKPKENSVKKQTDRPVQYLEKSDRPAFRQSGSARNKKNKWSVGLIAGNTLTRTNIDSRKLEIFIPGQRNLVVEAEDICLPVPGHATIVQPDHSFRYADVIYDILTGNHGKIYTGIRHRQPLLAGLSVARHINQEITLESGLLYTLLSSDLQAGNTSFFIQNQRLHYIGLPLKISYTFWKKTGFSLYTSPGVMGEICVSGILNTKYYKEGQLTREFTENLYTKRMQFSVLLSAGIQYSVIPHVGIFAEPGIIYYFDDKSKLNTIRKKRPFNFNIQAGIRLFY